MADTRSCSLQVCTEKGFNAYTLFFPSGIQRAGFRKLCERYGYSFNLVLNEPTTENEQSMNEWMNA